ncbi:nuclear transport factor 2 family protein [Bradyrhizobium paxllaeri]|uniref:nuclear transport factor 2 family protein n=1 Tax=Bradyrhizobium paxllaeri TaxID=190148 RepID=UPI000810E4F3|nr:nuclear transport factor 2 family protein [Bradyrhizobium paxllaeri]
MLAIDTVKAHYDALARRDLDAALDVIGDDAVWEFSGPDTIPFAGRWRGRRGAREFFERIRSTIEVREFRVMRMIADGDTVAVFGSERFLVKATGKEWAVEWVQVHEVRDGQIIRFREYTDTAAIAKAYAR